MVGWLRRAILLPCPESTRMADLPTPAAPEAARQARAEGRFYDAIDAWRALLLDHPDDPALALELKQDLKSALHYPDSDPQFRRAARHLGDAEWLAHYTALYAFHGTDLDVLDGRGRALLATQPHNPALHALLGDVARQRRDWAGAEQAFTDALRDAPGHPEYAAKRDAARMYQRVIPTLHDHGAPYDVAVVNMDRNTERWDELQRQFAGCKPPLRRVPAVEGSRLPSAAAARLTGDTSAGRGTLGCFLSHAAAWQSALDRGAAHTLVLEDDVIPLLDLPAGVGGLPLPGGYDVCFVNDRMEPRRDGDRLTAHPLPEVMQGFHPEDNAPGGDGYFISRAGAAKLMGWLAADGFCANLDWRLLAYSMTPAEIAALPRPSVATEILDTLAQVPQRPERMRAYVMHPALIRSVGVSSDREDQDRLAEGRR